MIQVLYFEGCPNHEPAVALTRSVLAELGLDTEIEEIAVETAEDAVRHRFLGSPTVRVDGQDIEPGARDRTEFSLCCRVYEGGGVPPESLLLAALGVGRQP